jgi:hypothetical protein
MVLASVALHNQIHTALGGNDLHRAAVEQAGESIVTGIPSFTFLSAGKISVQNNSCTIKA